jgi:hypothetical protein
MAKQKRGNDYFMARLEREHPAIFADWKAGRYATKRQALVASGLRKDGQTANVLKNAWGRATLQERRAFLEWLKPRGRSSLSAAHVDRERRLLPTTVARIIEILNRRGIRPGEMMIEMGLSPLDQSISSGIQRGTRLSAQLVPRLSSWLHKNRKA